VGYCSLFEYTGEGDTAYVGMLSAHPAWHGKGVGRDLLHAALGRTVQLGYSRLDLNTWAGNLKAVPLYKKSGYFWVPDTTVKMENYLPLIFRLPPAQAFFGTADWYADFKRDLSVRQDDEKRGNAQVYTYTWERAGKRLSVVVDRRAKGVAAIETDEYAVSLEIDDPRLPVGGRRTATWRIENRGARPVTVSVLSEGEDAVRCTMQRSAAIERAETWTAPVTAEQPQPNLPSNRPTNRLKSTVIVDGLAVPLVAGTQVSQPVSVDFDSTRRYLTPRVTHTMWLALENRLDEPSQGTLRLTATPGLGLDRESIDFALGARSRASYAVQLRPAHSGIETLRAQATVSSGGMELRTKVFALDLYCGEIGDLFIDRTDEYVRLNTDRIGLYASLKPTGDWMARVSVYGRESGGSLLSHATSVGPPFVPSPFANCTWTPRAERVGGALELVLTAEPESLPGLTFERHIRMSASGLMRFTYRAINNGSVARTLEVNAGTSVNLSDARNTYVAAHLKTGLVVDDSHRFPDWSETEFGNPDRYAESWMAEFGDGWVGATIWTQAKEVLASWTTPDIVLDLGTIEPGASVETPPIYVYAGQGDWRTARSLWRQLVAPDGARDVLNALPAHRARLERFGFDTDTAETHILLESDRSRRLSGEARFEGDGGDVLARGAVSEMTLGAPTRVAIKTQLPRRARAVGGRIVFDHEQTTDSYESSLLRLGVSGAPVNVTHERSGALERVVVDNGRMRLVVLPEQMGRVVELGLRVDDGAWQNQLHSPPEQPGVFVWFNPWYGGIHPTLDMGKSYPGRLSKERFTWTTTERVGAQGVRWRGITCSTVVTGADWSGVRPVNGLCVEVSYLTCGEGNVVAMPVRVVNDSASRADAGLHLHTFLQPGGDRSKTLLHSERDGEVRTHKRVHGGFRGASDAWCAVSGPSGSPTIALIPGAMNARVGDLHDMGLEGAHPSLDFWMRLAPGKTFESIGYVVVAEDVAQARLYKVLRSAGDLV